MDRDTAIEIAREWAWGHTELDANDQAEKLAPRLAQSLTERLPDNAVATALDHQDERVVLALAGTMVMVVRAEAARSGLWPRIQITARSIDPRTASISITDAFRGGYDGSGRTSGWRFELDGCEIEIPLHGRQTSVAERERQEAFAFALARAVGLDLPSVRRSAAQVA